MANKIKNPKTLLERFKNVDRFNEVIVLDEVGALGGAWKISDVIDLIDKLYNNDKLEDKERLDRSGYPRVDHFLRTCLLLPYPDEQKLKGDKLIEEQMEFKHLLISGLLHDAVEDGKISYEELRRRNFPARVLGSLERLHSPISSGDITKAAKNFYYNSNYIRQIADFGEPADIFNKNADLGDNTSKRRTIKLPEERQLENAEKYGPAIPVIRTKAEELMKTGRFVNWKFPTWYEKVKAQSDKNTESSRELIG